MFVSLLLWLAFRRQNRAYDVPGDKQAWGVITGLFALAAAPPAAASVLERFEASFWATLAINLGISFAVLLILVVLLRHSIGSHLYLDSANLLWGRILFWAAILAILLFNYADWNDMFRGADDQPFPRDQSSILLTKPVPLTRRLDAKVTIISGPLSRAETKSLQSFVDRLAFQEMSQDGNPDFLKVAWSAPFPENYSSIDCELFRGAEGNTCLEFLAREEIRGKVSQIVLRPLYFDEKDDFLTNTFTIPRPRAGEQLLVIFPTREQFDASVVVSVKHPASTN